MLDSVTQMIEGGVVLAIMNIGYISITCEEQQLHRYKEMIQQHYCFCWIKQNTAIETNIIKT